MSGRPARRGVDLARALDRAGGDGLRQAFEVRDGGVHVDLLGFEGDPASAAGGKPRKFQSLRRNDPDQVQGSRRISRISAPRRGSPRNGPDFGPAHGIVNELLGRACVACGPPLGLECAREAKRRMSMERRTFLLGLVGGLAAAAGLAAAGATPAQALPCRPRLRIRMPRTRPPTSSRRISTASGPRTRSTTTAAAAGSTVATTGGRAAGTTAATIAGATGRR